MALVMDRGQQRNAQKDAAVCIKFTRCINTQDGNQEMRINKELVKQVKQGFLYIQCYEILWNCKNNPTKPQEALCLWF